MCNWRRCWLVTELTRNQWSTDLPISWYPVSLATEHSDVRFKDLLFIAMFKALHGKHNTVEHVTTDMIILGTLLACYKVLKSP